MLLSFRYRNGFAFLGDFNTKVHSFQDMLVLCPMLTAGPGPEIPLYKLLEKRRPIGRFCLGPAGS